MIDRRILAYQTLTTMLQQLLKCCHMCETPHTQQIMSELWEGVTASVFKMTKQVAATWPEAL